MRATHLFRDDDELPSDRFDIQSLEKNKAYAQQMSADVAAGMRSFYQSMRIGVPDMDKAVTFWTKGCGALVLDTKLVNGVNVTRIGFGPQSFRRDDGAKFALEMVEGPSTRCEPQPLDRRAFRAEQLDHPSVLSPTCLLVSCSPALARLALAALRRAACCSTSSSPSRSSASLRS